MLTPTPRVPLRPGARVGILTSGGDAPGMNPAIRAAVKMCRGNHVVPVGIPNGYHGLIGGRQEEMLAADIEGLERRGGTMLGSTRSLEFCTEEGQARAAAAVKKLDLDALLVIGGNGSLAGAHVASQFQTARGERLRVVGIPASIDNDIGYTASAIGVDTALNTIVDACDKISDTAASHHRAFLVEVMGRDCGYLAMAAAIATGADAVLFRESGRSDDELVQQVVRVIASAYYDEHSRPHMLILKAEGVKVPLDVLRRRSEEELADLHVPVELRMVVLGHLVRGGSPSAQDRLMAGRLARAAVWAAIDGHTDVMIGWQSRSVPAGAGTTSPHDPLCAVIPLEAVLAETRALLEGTSEIARWRVRALSEVEQVLYF